MIPQGILKKIVLVPILTTTLKKLYNIYDKPVVIDDDISDTRFLVFSFS